MLEGGLIGYVKSKPLGTGQIISIDVPLDVLPIQKSNNPETLVEL